MDHFYSQAPNLKALQPYAVQLPKYSVGYILVILHTPLSLTGCKLGRGESELQEKQEGVAKSQRAS